MDSTHSPENVDKGDRATQSGSVPDPDKDPQAAEEALEEAEAKVAQREEEAQRQGKPIDEIEGEKLAKERAKRQQSGPTKPGQGAYGPASELEEVIELKGELKPSMSWQQIIRLLAGYIVTRKMEETYTRPSTTRIGITLQSLWRRKSGVIFPANRLLEDETQGALVLYFDTSGSMAEILPGQMNHIRKVLSRLKLERVWLALMGRPMEVGVYEPRRRKGRVAVLELHGAKVKKKGEMLLDKFVRRASLGGTEFSTDLLHWFKKNKVRRLGVVIFTDADSLWEENLRVINEMVKLAKGRVAMIVPPKDFEQVVNNERLRVNRNLISTLDKADTED